MTSPIGLAAYVLLFGLFVIAAWRRPASAIATLACIYGLKQLGETSHDWLAANAVISNIAVAMVAGVALVRRLLQGKLTQNRMPPVYWLIVAFYAYALASIIWTPALTSALRIWGHDYPYMILVIFVAPWLAINNDDLRDAFGWLRYAGGFLVIALLYTARWGERGLVVSSGNAFDETNPLAIADLSGVVAIAALFMVSARLAALGQFVRLFIAAVCAIVIVRSGSRGQLIAVSGTILLMLPVAYPVSRLRSSAAALAAIAAVSGAIAFATAKYVHWWDVRWVKSTAIGDATDRWTMVAELLRAWSRDGVSVLFGIGNSGSFSPSIAGFYPHNMPLEILGEEGALGFTLYMVIVARVFLKTYSGLRCAGNDLSQRGLLATTLGCFLFTLLVSLKQGNAVSSVTFFMFAVLTFQAAAKVCADNTQGRMRPVSPPLPTSLEPAFPNLLR
jgi:hypothetical protein